MTWPLAALQPDTVTIAPYSSMTSDHVVTYGTATTYAARINSGARRVVASDGREVVSNVQVIIEGRVNIDQRSRVTLPTVFVPNQPPIVAVALESDGVLDHTVLYL